MYAIGDLVVYGKTGVCQVRDITTPQSAGVEKERLYYVLQPLYGSCLIYAPVDTRVPMRPVISAEEAERVISGIPEIRAEAYFSDRTQELTEHYEAVMQSLDCTKLIRLAMSIYTKKQAAQVKNHKIGQIDERFMKQAEELICGEFSLALGIPKEKVPEYIVARVEALPAENA